MIKYADDFLEFQEKYHVNAVFAAAVTINECGAGTNCKIGGNNWFSIKGDGGWKSYDSPRGSIEDFYKLIANGSYYFTDGKFSVSEIGMVYCEDADAPGGWIESVTSYMTNMFQAAGISVTPSGVGGSAAEFLNILETYSQEVQKEPNTWKYSNSHKDTFQEAKRTNKQASCAIMANWGLVDLGVLKEGDRFYIDTSGNIRWNSSVEKRIKQNAKVILVNKNARQMINSGQLQAGDICLWGSGMGHTTVYAGEGKWYSAGHEGRMNGCTSKHERFKSFGPGKIGYLNSKTIKYIIRLNGN